VNHGFVFSFVLFLKRQSILADGRHAFLKFESQKR
jgi:hypothetical protein